MTRSVLVLCASALLTLVGCKVSTDYGRNCRMTKPGSAAGEVIPISKDQLPGTYPATGGGPASDYVALGAAECDDFICVRTFDPVEPYADDATNALGYCTRSCMDNSDCTPDYTGKDGTLKCDQVLVTNAEAIFGAGAPSKVCRKARLVNGSSEAPFP